MILEYTDADGGKTTINMDHVNVVEYDKDDSCIAIKAQSDWYSPSFQDGETASKAYEIIRKKWLIKGHVNVSWSGKINAWEV